MLKKILEHKITFIAAAIVFVVVVAGAVYFLFFPAKHVLTGSKASIMTIQQIVPADGKIDSDLHVSLSFPKGGRVVSVNAKVGDQVAAKQVLVTLDSSQLAASLAAAQADVLSGEANLTALKKGATSQTLDVYNQNISTAKLALATAVRDSYLKIQDALLNKISGLFDNNSSANPTLTIPTQDFLTTNNINLARVDMSDRMVKWNASIQSDPTGDNTFSETSKDVAAAKSFFDSLSQAVNRLTVSDSGMAQSVIDSDVSLNSAAATEVNAAEAEYNTALQAYKTTTDQLAVVQASSTPEALQIAEAVLTKAEANVSSIQSQINDTQIVAPFDGVIASINPRAGENFPGGSTAVDIISPGAFKIDVMIPENQVAAITVGDEADINFNAYGSDLTATGTVSSIDLSATVTNGVGAYKTTIYLNTSDPRIRTDMTASVTIKGISKDGVVAIPASAIINKQDGSYVLVLDKAGLYIERKIETGISDGNWTEVKSGLQTGEMVAAFGENGD